MSGSSEAPRPLGAPQPDEVPSLAELSDERTGAIGPFPSWGWLYASVVIYTAALTFLLWVFSVTLDHGAP